MTLPGNRETGEPQQQWWAELEGQPLRGEMGVASLCQTGLVWLQWPSVC